MAKLLVIDDDADFLTMIKMLLGFSDFSVDVANSGKEGLVKLKESDYDLIILDVMMPEMTGFEVCAAIRKDECLADIPIIMLTAKAEREDIIEGINAGANDYIKKPFDSEVLITKINSLIKIKMLQNELVKKNQLLENLAITDGLTGIFNHRFFYNKLNEEFERAKRYAHSLSCVMFDIDFFKKINDTYGHMAGDRILLELTKTVNDKIRKYDIFARYGGEEFVVLLPQTDMKGAFNEAERIRSAVELKDFADIMNAGSVTISLGILTYPDIDLNKAEDIVRFADQALYRAKKNGRNRTIVYDPNIDKGE